MNLKGVVGMDLREITYFLAIADEGYLTKAAQRLHVTQPTLSHFLAKLEKNLGVELFYRHNLVGLELTPAGRIYYDSARRIDHIWQSTLKSLEDSRDERLMHIHCGTSGAAQFTHALMECQSRMQERFPGLQIHTLSCTTAEIHQRLLAGTLDLGYSAYVPGENQLTYIPVGTSEVDLVVSKHHPLSICSYENPGSEDRRFPLNIASNMPFALIYTDSVLRLMEEEYFKDIGFKPNIASVYSYPSALKEYMINGGFAGLCPRYQHFDGMARIALDPPMYYTLGIYYRSGVILKDPLKSLVEMLQTMPYDYDL